MRKSYNKRNNRRYYLHYRLRKFSKNSRLVTSEKTIYVPYGTNQLERYAKLLQEEFNYGVQMEIK